MARQENSNKSTRDLILNAAFSFYEKPFFLDFSMSQVAQKVGISKAAIYRHFKNKEELVQQMSDSFFDLFAEKIVSIQKAKKMREQPVFRNQFKAVVVFFAENTQYINYFINRHTQIRDYEDVIVRELVARGVRPDSDEFFTQIKMDSTLKRYSHIYYCAVTFLLYIKLREKNLALSGNEGLSVEDFADRMIDFLHNGIVGTIGETPYFTKISEERFAELDKICEICADDMPEENRIFTAFAEVIKKYGMNGVTVERIAGELGMAKSSLYFYFENKNKMLFSLVSKEISFLKTACAENSVDAKSYTEFIYINMRTEISYFALRPSILAICGWLLQTTDDELVEKDNKECNESNNVWENRVKDDLKKIDLGFPILPNHFTFITGILPVALTFFIRKHKLSLEQSLESLRYLFDFAMYGVNLEHF